MRRWRASDPPGGSRRSGRVARGRAGEAGEATAEASPGRRAPRRDPLRYRERVVLLELDVNYCTQELVMRHSRANLRGHVSDAPTQESPFVTVVWDDGSESTLLPGNVRRIEEEV